MTPAGITPGRLERLSYPGANVVDQLLERHLGGRARRLAMSATAERASDDRHVDLTVRRAQAHLAAFLVEQLAHEHRDLGVLDRAQVVHDALGIGLDRAGLAEV